MPSQAGADIPKPMEVALIERIWDMQSGGRHLKLFRVIGGLSSNNVTAGSA